MAKTDETEVPAVTILRWFRLSFVAKYVGVTGPAVHYWRRVGRIPFAYRNRIFDMALECGVELTDRERAYLQMHPGLVDN